MTNPFTTFPIPTSLFETTNFPVNASGADRTLTQRFSDVVNVKDYGAVGDGNTDDSVALTTAAAMAAAGSSALYFPSGNYIYTGTGIPTLPTAIIGEGQDVSIVTITSNAWLFDYAGTIISLQASGILYQGGKGAFHFTSTAIDVQFQAHIHDNRFFNYSICAIGCNFADHPYWKIDHNLFYGVVTSSIGIAISGDCSGSDISNNSFLNNLYNIKLTPIAMTIQENDFVKFVAGNNSPVLTDIWIVAGSASLNETLQILNNKFGNENQSTADQRILIAAQNVITGDFAVDHASTGNVTTRTTLINIDDNSFEGAGNITAGILTSYTSDFDNIRFGRGNKFGGSQYLYFFNVVPTYNPSIVRFANNVVELPISTYPGTGTDVPSRLCNQAGVVFADDYAGINAGDSVYVPGRDGQDGNASYIDLLGGLGMIASTDVSTANGGTIAAVNDIYGVASAAQVTQSIDATAPALVPAFLTITNAALNQPFIIEIDVKQAAARSASLLNIYVSNLNTDTQFIRFVSLQNGWQTIRLWGRFLAIGGTNQLRFAIPPGGSFSAGVTDRFTIGRIRMYYATDPVNYGPLQTHAIYTVATLPPAANFRGASFLVRDATATTFWSIAAGTGGNVIKVTSDGVNWRIG